MQDTTFDLWQLAHPVKAQRSTSGDTQHWQRPDHGWIKCNVDAAFSESSTGATGMVLRDHDARSCGGKAIWHDHCLNALTTEALTCRDGMQFARNRGVRKLIVETDRQVLVNLWEQCSS